MKTSKVSENLSTVNFSKFSALSRFSYVSEEPSWYEGTIYDEFGVFQNQIFKDEKLNSIVICTNLTVTC